MAPSEKKVFTLEGKGLKLDTAEDLDAHIKELREMEDVEEVRILGNTLGIGACKLLGEVLSTKKNLKVCLVSLFATAHRNSFMPLSLTIVFVLV